MPTTCAGSQKNGDSCDCTLFVPKSNGKRCKSCGHRRVSHSNIPTPPSQDANTNITVAPRQEPSKYVNRLFRSLEATAVHENARRETLQGFRPQPSSAIPVPSSKKGKGKGARVSSRVVSQSMTTGLVKFGRIVIFPCGDQNIHHFKFPTINSNALQPWVNGGLAVEADDSGLIFQLDWGSKQFNSFLRHQFPLLFSHFDSISPGFKSIPDEPDAAGMKRIEYTLPYVLLQKMRKNYHIVDDTHPVATMYKANLSGDTTSAGFRAKSIFLVTKEPIPQQILNDWFAPAPAPIIPDVPTVQLRMTKAGNKRNRAESISVSSDSSEVSQDVSDYAPKDITTVGDDEETDTDDVKIIDKRPKKRTRVLSPQAQGSPIPEFIEGSSKDDHQDLDHLAQQLKQSASFEEGCNPTWVSDEEAELWNF